MRIELSFALSINERSYLVILMMYVVAIVIQAVALLGLLK